MGWKIYLNSWRLFKLGGRKVQVYRRKIWGKEDKGRSHKQKHFCFRKWGCLCVDTEYSCLWVTVCYSRRWCFLLNNFLKFLSLPMADALWTEWDVSLFAGTTANFCLLCRIHLIYRNVDVGRISQLNKSYSFFFFFAKKTKPFLLQEEEFRVLGLCMKDKNYIYLSGRFLIISCFLVFFYPTDF